VVGRVPFGAWKTLTFVAALRCDEMSAAMLITGAMNGEAFLAYVEQCLLLARGNPFPARQRSHARHQRTAG
jgi:hypothetical protein